jgi:hypothetical protein
MRYRNLISGTTVVTDRLLTYPYEAIDVDFEPPAATIVHIGGGYYDVTDTDGITVRVRGAAAAHAAAQGNGT